MIDKLDFLVRFWELKARNASLGEPLGPVFLDARQPLIPSVKAQPRIQKVALPD